MPFVCVRLFLTSFGFIAIRFAITHPGVSIGSSPVAVRSQGSQGRLVRSWPSVSRDGQYPDNTINCQSPLATGGRRRLWQSHLSSVDAPVGAFFRVLFSS